MMTSKDLIEIINNTLSVSLADKYVAYKSKDFISFEENKDEVKNVITFYYLKYGNEYGLKISFSIHHYLTEKIYGYLFGLKKKNIKEGNTLFYGPYKYKSKKIQPVLAKDPKGVKEWLTLVFPLIKDTESSFFSMNQSTNDLDGFINKTEVDERLIVDYARCRKGLILAKLNNTISDELIEKYDKIAKETEVDSDYDKYISYLKNNTVEKILKDIK